MKLALITPDGLAQCLVCRWTWKAPSKKRKGGELALPERLKVLEENLLAHLRYSHDRMLHTKEEQPTKEEGVPGKIYYHGRRPERNL